MSLRPDGALFFDELSEFDRATLEASRAAMSPASSGGLTVVNVTEEDF